MKYFLTVTSLREKEEDKLGLSWDKLSKDVLAGQGLLPVIVFLLGLLLMKSSYEVVFL